MGDYLYDYYKNLPRDAIVGGFLEFTGGEIEEDLSDIEVDGDEIHAEIYGASDGRLNSASTIDEGILKLFSPADLRSFYPKKYRETKTMIDLLGSTKKKTSKRKDKSKRKKKKKGKVVGGCPCEDGDDPEEFALGEEDSPLDFSLI